jgi:hypothetical protein
MNDMILVSWRRCTEWPGCYSNVKVVFVVSVERIKLERPTLLLSSSSFGTSPRPPPSHYSTSPHPTPPVNMYNEGGGGGVGTKFKDIKKPGLLRRHSPLLP